MGVYMRADDPLAKKPEVWMQDLEGRPLLRNAIKLSKILIAHASNSVCFFMPFSSQLTIK